MLWQWGLCTHGARNHDRLALSPVFQIFQDIQRHISQPHTFLPPLLLAMHGRQKQRLQQDLPVCGLPQPFFFHQFHFPHRAGIQISRDRKTGCAALTESLHCLKATQHVRRVRMRALYQVFLTKRASIPSRLRNFSAILWDVSYSSIESSGWRWSPRRNWIISSLHCSAFSLICSVSISFLPELE